MYIAGQKQHTRSSSPVSIQTQRTQRNRLRCVRCVRCVNENRKQRKRLIGCLDDWLFRPSIPIGWRLRALRLNGNRFYAIFFVCVISLRLLRFLRTFLMQSIALRALRALRLDGNRASLYADNARTSKTGT